MPKRLVLYGSAVSVVAMIVWYRPLSVQATVRSDAADASSTTAATQFDPSSRSSSGKKRYTPGRLLVKFKGDGSHALTACAHCLLAQRKKFQDATADRSDSLDQLNKQFKVLGARSLFHSDAEELALTSSAGLETLATRTQRYQARMAAVKAKYFRRTRRAAADAVLPDLSATYLLEVPEEADVESIARRYAQDPHVEYAQPDYLITVQYVPNDPYYASNGSWGQRDDDLWGLKKLQLGSAWDVSQGQGVVVAVLDTGLDYNHPDIAANVWMNPGEIPSNGLDDDQNGFVDDIRGWNFTNNTNNPMDGYGHGTHVSGTIAAVGNNNLGIIGVAPQAKIMPVKALGDLGFGSMSHLAAGIVYAAENGADVINNSWGCRWGCPSNPIAEDAVRTASGLGAVVVFAAANNADDVEFYSPQNMTDPKPIVVAASTPNDAPTFFTNMGYLVDVTAPGGGTTDSPPRFDPFRNILSLKSTVASPDMDGGGQLIVGQQYVRQAGTSMSAPHACGVAALVLAYRPSFTNEDVRQALRASADDVNNPGFDRETGTGRLNAARALAVPSVLQVKITSPTYGATLSQQANTVTITGTATGADFKQYALSYGQGFTPSTWKAFGGTAVNPVVDGTLGTWAVWDLADGTYVLRLDARTHSGQLFQTFVLVALERNPPQQITTDFDTQVGAVTEGNRIVWRDYRNGNEDIYLYDLATNTERRITADPTDQIDPAISGDKVVWEDYRNGYEGIYLYDLTTNTERRITTSPMSDRDPAISGNRIVWQDGRNGTNFQIYLYDLATNTEQRITTDSANHSSPAISGDKIVWLDQRNGNFDIYLYDLATNTERRITSAPATRFLPRISGDKIVWEDNRSGTNWDIYLYDLATNTERRITTDSASQRRPRIAGDRIVWEDQRNGNLDVYLYDLATNTERQITAHAEWQGAPDISGDRMVWTDFRSGNWDIYMTGYTQNSPPVIEPLANQTVTAGKLLVFPVRASDPDKEVLAITAQSLPAGASLLPQGDVTQDGVLSAADVDLISRCAAGTATCTPLQVGLGDVTGPAGLTAADAQTVQAMLQERAAPSGNDGLLTLLNTRVFIWATTAADADTSPYNTVRFRTADSIGVSTETTVGITVSSTIQNLLTNGGFESGQTGWSGWSSSKLLTTDTAYTGTTALEIVQGTGVRQLDHVALNVTAGTTYRVRGSVKTVGLSDGRAYIQVIWKQAGGGTLRTDTFGYTSGTIDWVRYNSALTAPPNAARMFVSLVAEKGSGTAYFDAVRVEK